MAPKIFLSRFWPSLPHRTTQCYWEGLSKWQRLISDKPIYYKSLIVSERLPPTPLYICTDVWAMLLKSGCFLFSDCSTISCLMTSYLCCFWMHSNSNVDNWYYYTLLRFVLSCKMVQQCLMPIDNWLANLFAVQITCFQTKIQVSVISNLGDAKSKNVTAEHFRAQRMMGKQMPCPFIQCPCAQKFLVFVTCDFCISLAQSALQKIHLQNHIFCSMCQASSIPVH